MRERIARQGERIRFEALLLELAAARRQASAATSHDADIVTAWSRVMREKRRGLTPPERRRIAKELAAYGVVVPDQVRDVQEALQNRAGPSVSDPTSTVNR